MFYVFVKGLTIQHVLDPLRIGLIYDGKLLQTLFALGRFLGEDVIVEGVLPLNLS